MAHHSTKFCGVASHLTNDLGCCCGGNSWITFDYQCTVHWKCDTTVVRCEVRFKGTELNPANLVISTKLEGSKFLDTNPWGGTWELWVACSPRGKLTLASSTLVNSYNDCPSCCSVQSGPRLVSFNIPSEVPHPSLWGLGAYSRYSGTHIISPNSSGCAGNLIIDSELPTLFELCASLGTNCEPFGTFGRIAFLRINGSHAGELVHTIHNPAEYLSRPPYYRPEHTVYYYWQLKKLQVGWSVGNDGSSFPFSAYVSVSISVRQYAVMEPPLFSLPSGAPITALVGDSTAVIFAGTQDGCEFTDVESYAAGNPSDTIYFGPGSNVKVSLKIL